MPFNVNQKRPARKREGRADRVACVYLGAERRERAIADAKKHGFGNLSAYLCFLVDNAKLVNAN